MSTPGAGNESGRQKEGLGRFIRRFRAVLRRGSAATGSAASPADLPSSENTPATTTKSPITAIPPQIQDVPSLAAAEPMGDSDAAPIFPDARTAERYERVKAMFAKYNLPFDEDAWPNKPFSQLARVEKPIRMRVRIVCHFCRTNYSASKECTNCHHQRCEKCTRIPAKNRRKGKEREHGMKATERTEENVLSAAARANVIYPPEADTGAFDADAEDEAEDEADRSRAILKTVPKKPKRRKEVPLTVPSRTGGQEMIRKEPLQRIHRHCCKCQGSFVRDSKQCPQCSHVRCTKCPREPPKLDKWPAGYPGDVLPAEPERPHRQWKKPRVRVRWTCHECRKLFMEGEYRCANCSHARCSDCEREPPKRERGQIDNEVVQSVQEKLAAVGASSEHPDLAEGPSVVASSSGTQREATETAGLEALE